MPDAEDPEIEPDGGEIGPECVVPITDSLDLHSFLPRDVASVVESYIDAAVDAGFGEVRIIHGRGIGAQRELVRALLARDPRVAAFSDAPPERGGWGATVALLLASPPRARSI